MRLKEITDWQFGKQNQRQARVSHGETINILASISGLYVAVKYAAIWQLTAHIKVKLGSSLQRITLAWPHYMHNISISVSFDKTKYM